MSRDHLPEILRWLKPPGPKIGCLLCVGKLEEIRWMAKEIVRLRQVEVFLQQAPTHPMRAILPPPPKIKPPADLWEDNA